MQIVKVVLRGCVALGMLLQAVAGWSAEIKVDSLADSGAGSLRSAVAGAADGDVVLLRATGELILKTPITVRRSIRIEGQSGPLAHTISGGSLNRLFIIERNKSVTLSRLTLADGNVSGDGGAIFSQGHLSLEAVQLINNHATGQGGGVFQSGGSLTLSQSHLAGNTAGGNGGAVSTDRTPLRVQSSAFYDNGAGGLGGALNANGASLELINSTLAGNQAGVSGGGAAVATPAARVINVTFVDNAAPESAHLHATVGASVSIGNSLVAGSGGFAGFAGSGLLSSLGSNLSNGPSADWNAADDRSELPLGLGELGNYGGVSPVYPLEPGSPAIDAGNNTQASGADQRGLARFSDGNADGTGDVVDVGAFEVQLYRISSHQIFGAATGGEDDAGFGNPFDPSDDASSIASADVFKLLTQKGKADIGDAVGANNAAGWGAIAYADSLIPGRTFLKGSQLEVRRTAAIYGPGAQLLAIDGDGRSRIMRIQDGATAYLQGISIENGSAAGGGAILVESGSKLELDAVSVMGNRSSLAGGGIAVDSGSAYLYRTALIGNTAQTQGGALSVSPGAQAVLDNSTVSSNRSNASAGAVATAGQLWIESSTLAGNVAAGDIPGVLIRAGGSASIRNSLFAQGTEASIVAESGGVAISGGNNLSTGNDLLLADSTDQLQTDPMIGALALNGGTTLSHAPSAPGPAINSGNNEDSSPIDQPGFARIRGGLIDIGAVEFQNDVPILDCALPVSVECVNADGASVTISAGAFDPDGDSLTLTWLLDGAVIATDTLPTGATSPARFTQTLALPIGDYTVSLVLADAYSSATCTVPVSVHDFIPPVVTLIGEALVELECGQSYTDPGALAGDTCDQNPVVFVEKSNLPESGPLTTGTYSITYSAVDASGNKGSATRTILVTDTTPPTVTLNGAETIILESGLDSWVDPGAFASDICSGGLPVLTKVFSGSAEVPAVSTLDPGTFTVVYLAVDASGNEGIATRTVAVRDTIAPVVAAPEDVNALTDPGFCSARIAFSASATDNASLPPVITYTIRASEAYPDGPTISSPFDFAPGIHEVIVTATDASGNAASTSFIVEVTDDFLNCVQNLSWPNALPLDPVAANPGNRRVAEVRQFLALTDQARWYRFTVTPGSRVTVILSELPANYDLVVYRDIAREYLRQLDLFNSGDPEAEELALLGVEFAPESFSPESFSPESFSPESFSPESFSPESFSPESFSPESFSPESFSPESFSPESFSPESFSPESFSPESFSPESFSPESFSPESFSPESFSPESFSAAQVSSMIAYSAFPGVASEGVSVNTFNRSGDFYLRVRGSNGAFNRSAPFRVTIIIEQEICEGVLGAESFGPSSLVPSAGGFETLILWDPSRTSGTVDELSRLQTQLAAFAARPEVRGAIVDVSLEDRVVMANIQADANPACPYAKNLVAEEIKAIVDAYRALNPGLRYIVLLGNDDVIPFFRTEDEAFLANEANYIPPVLDATHSQSSLRFGQVLTQDPYGASCVLNLATGPFAYPEIPVGRLVETVAEMTGQLDNYLATADGTLRAPASALVTGYDFLDDAARAVQFEFEQALGGPVASLISDSTLSPSEGWTATDLGNILFGDRHDLVFLAGHFSTGSALAADYETRLTAAQLAASGADFLNTIVFSAGCHSGYNTVDRHAINGITRQPDWAQAFSRLGAILIAGTGYQYGDTEFVEYGERLYLEFARQLRTGTGPVSIGEALVRAKRKYLTETPLMRGIHEKTLVQTTLFGLPMIKVDVPGIRLLDTFSGSPSGVTPSAVTANPGLTLRLSTGDFSVLPQLTPRSLDLLNIEDGSTVTARWFDGRSGSVTSPAEPARPLETYLVGKADALLRGVGFRGGSYSDLPGFLPLTGAPTTEIRGVYGNFFSEVYYPVQPYSVNYFGTLCGGTDGDIRLNVYPAQFLATGGGVLGGTMRTYDRMDFRLFYSNNRETYTASGVPSIPALAAAPAIAKVASASTTGDVAVEFRINILGNPAAGIQEAWITYTGVPGSIFHGEWRPLDLAQDEQDSTLWKGILDLQGASPDEIRFMVQAASGTGLVSLSTNFGHYHEVGVDELATRQPTTIELINPPTEGAYGQSLPVQARLSSEGLPLAGVRVGFRIGNSKISGFTNADGVAEVLVPLTTRPSLQLLQAYYQGDRIYAPSAAGSEVNVSKQATQLIFQPVPVPVFGRDVVVALQDALGTPLKERTVFFLVDYGTLQLGNSVITDFAGRADLSELQLPAGDAVITAFFNGVIPLPGADPVTINDDLYLPSVASVSVTLAEPAEEESLVFKTQRVDVHYKSASSKGKTTSPPLYENASISGGLAFAVPLQPADILASASASSVQATIEARLAGQLIASETVVLDTRGENRRHWTTARRPGEEVAYVGIHWSEAPRFDSALSSSPGPRLYTTFIGNNFTDLRFLPVSGSYRTVFPDGRTVVVKNGVVDLANSTALKPGDYNIQSGELVIALNYGIQPGMTFVTRTLSTGRIIAQVTAVEGTNYLREGGRMLVRLEAVNGTPMPASNAEPNLFEARIRIGSGPGETEVRAAALIGAGEGAVPWSSESPNHKQYRP